MAYTETPAQFFERLNRELPGTAEGQSLADVGGVVEFEVEGNKSGDDSAFFTFDLDATNVVPGTADDAGKTPAVLIRGRGLDLMALFEGRMSPQDGVLTERLHVAGDLVHLSRLLAVLEAAASAARAA